MIEMLDMKKQWAKIKAGFQDGPFFRRPDWNPHPSSFKDGPGPMARQAQQSTMTPNNASAFSGKTFSQKHGGKMYG